jgi:hypothetical protein
VVEHRRGEEQAARRQMPEGLAEAWVLRPQPAVAAVMKRNGSSLGCSIVIWRTPRNRSGAV